MTLLALLLPYLDPYPPPPAPIRLNDRVFVSCECWDWEGDYEYRGLGIVRGEQDGGYRVEVEGGECWCARGMMEVVKP